MQINLEFDSSVEDAPDPAGFIAAVQAAASSLDALLIDPITVNIAVGYGEVGGYNGKTGETMTKSAGQGGPVSGIYVTYAQLQQDLTTHLTSAAQKEVLANLPAVDPSGGGKNFYISPAEEKAWGMLSADGSEVDGEVGFHVTIDNGIPMIGGIEHELTHALGRIAQNPSKSSHYSLLDLTRYASPGVLASQSTAAPYFSIDGGNTSLKVYAADNGTDAADWAPTTPPTPDSFDAIQVAGTDPVTPVDLTLVNILGFTEAPPPCFAAGTRIATARGPVAVERLRVGDLALTASGALRPMVWLGHCRVECRRHPCPANVQPVRIAAHAFDLGRPRRDLFVSPDHSVFVDGILIPVRYLLNDATVRQVDFAMVTYWHVELDQHDVILAEGLPCESFLDTSNRAAFENGGTVSQIHPDFAQRLWDADACAPIVVAGPQIDQMRDRLHERLLTLAEPGRATKRRQYARRERPSRLRAKTG